MIPVSCNVFNLEKSLLRSFWPSLLGLFLRISKTTGLVYICSSYLWLCYFTYESPSLPLFALSLFPYLSLSHPSLSSSSCHLPLIASFLYHPLRLSHRDDQCLSTLEHFLRLTSASDFFRFILQSVHLSFLHLSAILIGCWGWSFSLCSVDVSLWCHEWWSVSGTAELISHLFDLFYATGLDQRRSQNK